MEVVAYINQNLPIWSILCGDHALVEEVKLINENLIKNPKLESTLENKLRHSIFKHKRAFIDETIKNTASFALVSLSFEELMDENLVQTCFTEISFKRFAEEHWKAGLVNQGFSIARKTRPDWGKSKEDVAKIFSMGDSLEKSFKKEQVTEKMILDTKIGNIENIHVAANRGMWCKRRSGKIDVLDGTHRTLAYLVWKLRNPNSTVLPNKLYGFYWEEEQ
jgi:hypothetical protein